MTSQRDRLETSDGKVTQSHLILTLSVPKAGGVDNTPNITLIHHKGHNVIEKELAEVV
jgi:hypothetical protein